LGGTSVLMAGRELPLVRVSGDRIDAIIPYDVPANTQHQLIVQTGSSTTTPEPVTVAPAQPAIFTADKTGSGQGQIYVVTADGPPALADASHPVKAGDTILIQCAGLGAVDPPVNAGTSSPDSPPSRTVNAVSVKIGGVDATVSFAGLAPGSTGVYQVNVTVPQGVTAGAAVPVVLSVAGQISPPVTITVQ
jgi:uncharacterized protein (TIGR03437 family)